MLEFKEIKEKYKLQILLDGFKGSLYITKDTPHSDTLLIRHFDGNISKDLIPEMVEMTKKIGDWFEKHFKNQIQVAQFMEYGEDYIMRKFFLYQTSLSYVENPRNKMPIPQSLKTIRKKIKEHFQNEEMAEVVKNVISKSMLQPAKKTVYDKGTDTYKIVELSVNEEDLKDWKLAKNKVVN